MKDLIIDITDLNLHHPQLTVHPPPVLSVAHHCLLFLCDWQTVSVLWEERPERQVLIFHVQLLLIQSPLWLEVSECSYIGKVHCRSGDWSWSWEK